MDRKDFPLLSNYPELVYLDSACTSLKPTQVIEAEASYYKEYGACAGRSSHRMGRKTNEKLDEVRETVARFVGADKEGIVWTRNTTEGLNLVANSLDYSKKKRVVTTVMEHHAVLLPFMKLRDKGIIELEVLGCDENGEVPLERWQEAVDRKTALAVTNNGNNTTGCRQNVKEIGKIAHDSGALLCVDGAQGVAHHTADFRKEGMDFLCFSAHKMLGPTGIGALAAKKELLATMEQFITGGGTVKTVTLEKAERMDDYTRFEAGIQDYGGILGFQAACEYLKGIGMEKVEAHERSLGEALVKEVKEAGAKLCGTRRPDYAAICSFNFGKAKPHDVALMLDKENIAVRSGFFCAQPAMEAMGAKEGAVRASCYVYNTQDDVKRFGEALQKLRALYG